MDPSSCVCFVLGLSWFLHPYTIQGPAYKMEPPTFMLDLLTSLVISTTPKDMPTGQPDLDSSSLRGPSRVILHCVKLTIKNHAYKEFVLDH